MKELRSKNIKLSSKVRSACKDVADDLIKNHDIDKILTKRGTINKLVLKRTVPIWIQKITSLHEISLEIMSHIDKQDVQ